MLRFRCQGCHVGLSSQHGAATCLICSAPNNLLVVAARSRLAILMQRERRSVFILSIIVLTFQVCWLPAWTAFLVRKMQSLCSKTPTLKSMCNLDLRNLAKQWHAHVVNQLGLVALLLQLGLQSGHLHHLQQGV